MALARSPTPAKSTSSPPTRPNESLEIYGGYGFIKEFPAEKFYRDAKIGKLYEGTSNMQLTTIFKLIDKA